MPAWLLWTTIVSLVGYIAYEKTKSTPSSATALGMTPKERYEQGHKEGYTAGFEDGKAKKLPRISATMEQLEDVGRTPELWMNDPDKSYALGYNFGYMDGYRLGIAPPVISTPLLTPPAPVPLTPPTPVTLETTPPPPEPVTESPLAVAAPVERSYPPASPVTPAEPDSSPASPVTPAEPDSSPASPVTPAEPVTVSTRATEATGMGSGIAMPSLTLGTNVSAENRDKIPYWFSHPSFRRMG